MYRIKNSFFIVLISVLGLKAQNLDSLVASLEPKENIKYTDYIFKGTKIINGHSIECTKKGALQLMFQHRFSPIGNGIKDFFGLDGATIRFGFDYGITKWLSVGIGRSTTQKAYDGFLKAKLFRQSNKMPFGIVLVGTTAIKTDSWNAIPADDIFAHRMFYTTQLIIARKFTERFSAQITPTLVHRNYVTNPNAQNNVFALGLGLRYKISKRMAIVGEYFYANARQLEDNYFGNTVALGLDIETGGHIFQLHFTNASGMVEHQFIGMTRENITNGINSIRIGFNLNRVFTLVKNSESSW